MMVTLDQYPRLPGETDDAPRILRAVEDNPLGTLLIPEGTDDIASPIIITNQCSLQMEPMTRLVCRKEMDFVIEWIGPTERAVPKPSRNLCITGGEIDGMGLASCLRITNYVHFTLANTTFKNGKKYGLCIGPDGGGVEVIANNLYFSNQLPGLQGNIGIYTRHTDGHFTDVIIVDYTYGVVDERCCSNRYTRVHVWNGAMQVDGVPQYIKGSVNFVLKGGEDSSEVLLRECYADTGEIGFDIYTGTRLLACAYYNNYDWLKFDNVLAIRNNTSEDVQIFDGCWSKTSPHAVFYQGNPDEHVYFRDNVFRGGLEPNHPLLR